jgi:hypothetical protein
VDGAASLWTITSSSVPPLSRRRPGQNGTRPDPDGRRPGTAEENLIGSPAVRPAIRQRLHSLVKAFTRFGVRDGARTARL